LETRAALGGVLGGVVTGSLSAALLGAKVSSPLMSIGSKPGGAGDGSPFAFAVSITRSSGEEIPQ
jgi:hypothetical protein